MTAFVLAAGALVWFAIPDGSYDIVSRQSEAVAVWWVIGLGAALGLLPRARVRSKGIWVLGAFAALAVWTALGLLWTSSDERTLAEVVRVVHYVGIVALVWCLISPTTWRPAAAGVLAAAVAVCGLAIASRLAPEQLSDDIAKAVGNGRLSYPLGYWNAVAAWGAMTVAMALVWSAHARSAVVRAASLAAVPLAVSAVYLSYSRAGIGDIAIALVAALALSLNRWTVALHALAAGGSAAVAILVIRGQPEIADGTGAAGAGVVLAVLAAGALLCAISPLLTQTFGVDRRRLPLLYARLGTGVLVFLFLIALVTVGRGPISEAWDDFRDTGRARVSDTELRHPASRLTSVEGARYEVWSSALRAVRDDRLHGIGPGTFEFHWNQDGGRIFVRDAHSLYLEQAAELGLPGALLTIAALLGLAFLGARASFRFRDPGQAGAAAALSAAFLVYLFHAGIDWMWESTAVTALALVAGSLAVGPPRRTRSALGWRPRAALVLLSILACAAALPGLLSTTKVRGSREAFREGRLTDARSLAESAVSRQPWAAEPHVQRGLVRWADGDLAGAAADLREARDSEPMNWRHPLLLARLEAERGRAGPAARAFRDARRLRPASPFLPPAKPVGVRGRP